MPPNTQRSQGVALGITELYERYGPDLRFFLERQLRLRHKVEDVLHDVFECLLKYPPTQELQKADHYLWRIAWRLVNAANRRVDVDRERIALVVRQADGWVFGRSS